MKEYKNILFNYKRNLVRLKQIEKDYSNVSAVRYDKPIGNTGTSKPIENAVIGLSENKEYNRVKSEINIVERVLEQLDYRKKLVFQAYFVERKCMEWLPVGLPLSISTEYRDRNAILEITKKETEIEYKV